MIEAMPPNQAGGCDPGLCPLNRVRAGCAVRIKRLSTSPEVSTRLRELGFCEEQRIRLLRRDPSFICQVCNARLAIHPDLAASIWVELLPAEKRAA